MAKADRRMETVSVVHRDRFQDLLAQSMPCLNTGIVNLAAVPLRETPALADLDDKALVDDCRERLHYTKSLFGRLLEMLPNI